MIREIVLNAELDPIKYKLCSREDFNSASAFFEIDLDGAGVIHFDKIKAFYKNNKKALYDDEIHSLIRRIDKKGDGYITLFEFKEAIEPMDADLRNQIKSIEKKSFKAIGISKEENGNSQNVSNYASLYCKTASKSKLSPSSDFNRSSKSQLRPSTATPKLLLDNYISINNSKLKFGSQNSSPTKWVDPNNIRLNQTAYKHSKKVIASVNLQKSPPKDSRNKERGAITSIPKEITPSSVLKKSKIITSKNEAASSSPHVRKFSPIDSTKFSPLLSENKQLMAKINRSVTPTPRLEAPNLIMDLIPKVYINIASLSVNQGKNLSNEYDNIVNTLKKFTSLENELEVCKQDLALRPDFNLYDFFKVFDIQNKGVLTSSDMEKGLKLFDVYFSEEELAFIVNKYDKDKDGLMKFSFSFVKYTCKITRYKSIFAAFTPKQFEYSILLNNRISIVSIDQNIKFEEVRFFI